VYADIEQVMDRYSGVCMHAKLQHVIRGLSLSTLDFRIDLCLVDSLTQGA